MTPAIRAVSAGVKTRREAALTLMLVVQCAAIFIAAPLAARGIAAARYATETFMLLFGVLVIAITRGRAATAGAAILVSCVLAIVVYNLEFPSALTEQLADGGSLVVLGLVGYVVARAVFAPGSVTAHRLLGAVVLYLNIGLCFSAIFRILRDVDAGAFAGIPPEAVGPEAFAALVYFSLVSLTSVGFGDIVPIHPFARSLTSLEAVIGQLYPATLVAALVTQHLETRRR